MNDCPPPDYFKVLVTGSRDWRRPEDITVMLDAVLAEQPHLMVIHGGCPTGADMIAGRWAFVHRVPMKVFSADWSGNGKQAGYLRNTAMVNHGVDRCLAFIRNGSRGASHCAATAMGAGVLTVVIRDDG
jgi:hypothetical protein